MEIRALDEKDIGEISLWATDESVKRWIFIDNWHDYFNAVKDDENYFLFAICIDNSLVGELSAERIEDYIAISIIINPLLQGKGIAAKALNKFYNEITVLIKHKPLYVRATIYPNNLYSIKCFEKAGYIKNGLDEDGGIVFIRKT